ncbi:hypothetical protein [Bacillus velezensis]|uniref:hypothetical protein n=1 Tax=Bacillus velezensis TaxID=492670 RepID=UPI0021F14FD5|nr:hypothetical protein [Bacillus velezensis]MCV4329403.1 hypothetical protein [Bacillus velezensis]
MESAWRRLFMCPGQIRDALDAAEGDPRPSMPMRCRQERAAEGKTPRVYGAIGRAISSAPRRELSVAHRSCGGCRIPEPIRRRLFVF